MVVKSSFDGIINYRTLLSVTTMVNRITFTRFYFLAAPIRNMLVPQVGQTPLLAGLQFFMVIALALFISFLERHFTQYASIFFLPVFGSLYFI